ncbi:KTSC domain-containing protein [Citrobacter portucalensis]|uniref:KTSC domain-containing protein n=1 Tax=Citrobacter portucalensis TaxID=1639133 RepID=UPI00351D5485
MIRQPVSSSNLQSVGYDQATSTLEIAFHSSGIYQYSRVPSAVHTALMNAPSKVSILMPTSKKLATLIAKLANS